MSRLGLPTDAQFDHARAILLGRAALARDDRVGVFRAAVDATLALRRVRAEGGTVDSTLPDALARSMR